MLKDKKVSEFLNELAAKTPTPGGGSASAMAGAMAASLVVMVVEFTLGKKKYQKVEKEFQKVLKEAQKLQKELTALIDEDNQAYLQVVKTNNSQEAIKNAAQVPLQTAQKSLAVFKLAAFARKSGNQNLSSDSFCALQLAKAAVSGALENVKINLPFIEDKKFADELEIEIKKTQKILQDF